MCQEQAWPPGPQRLRDRRESQEEEGDENLLTGGWRITGRVGTCEQWGRTVDPSSLETLTSHGQGPWCLHGAVFLVKGWSGVLRGDSPQLPCVVDTGLTAVTTKWDLLEPSKLSPCSRPSMDPPSQGPDRG